MDTKSYIESGILELYIAGALTESEMIEVSQVVNQYPEVKEEVIKIEAAIVSLTSSVAPSNANYSFTDLKNKLGGKIVPINTEVKTSWTMYSGWAAAVVIGAGLFMYINKTNQLEQKIQTAEIQNKLIELDLQNSQNKLVEMQNVLSVIRNKNIIIIPLAGQVVSPEAYAKVYWDKETKSVYIDVKGLPTPPKDMVYQVWSLKLNPLTPTSLGILDTYTTDADKIIAFSNINESEAFGITLEPKGGSINPTLDQLYTLGTVQ